MYFKLFSRSIGHLSQLVFHPGFQGNNSKRKMSFARMGILALWILSISAVVSLGGAPSAASDGQGDYIVKINPNADRARLAPLFESSQITPLGESWLRVKSKPTHRFSMQSLMALKQRGDIIHIQPNYRVRLLTDYKILDEAKRQRLLNQMSVESVPPDNPDIPSQPEARRGNDPLYDKQWGMKDLGVSEIRQVRGKQIVVAVLDSGVDYTHEDLVRQMWRNPGETGRDGKGRDKSSNRIDDDKNGYVDDVVGWDFADSDSKPYDLIVDLKTLLGEGGNPGHGTHCAGNIAAGKSNGKGIKGVGHNIKIMALRFLDESGMGSTADAISAIRYAVDNGAQVLSNSWGSEGQGSNEDNRALREAIEYSEAKGSLFIAAAGNGRWDPYSNTQRGYNNDTDSAPGYPASYSYESIISVAALDQEDELGGFSNFGFKRVHIGAPGVDVFSTTPLGYNNVVAEIPADQIKITWDGTSMATPHVAGAAALYWSVNANKTWKEVKDALLNRAIKIPALSRKVSSEGKLNLVSLLKE